MQTSHCKNCSYSSLGICEYHKNLQRASVGQIMGSPSPQIINETISLRNDITALQLKINQLEKQMSSNKKTFTEFQTEIHKYKKFKDETALYYLGLGLTGEAGEVAEKIKKIIRDQDGKVTEVNKAAIALELSDVLFYVASLATEIGMDLGEVAQLNVEKLESRLKRGVIGGSGDNR